MSDSDDVQLYLKDIARLEDELTEVQEEAVRLKSEAGELRKAVREAVADRDKQSIRAANAERDHYRFHFDQEEQRAERAEARVKRLEEALQEARDYIAEDDPGEADTAGFHDALISRLDRALSEQMGDEMK